MSIELITALIIISVLAFLLSGIPVAFSLIGVSLLFYIILKGPGAFYFLVASIYGTTTKDLYLAIPFFVFMAAVLQSSGLGTALYNMMYKWFGGLRGGLAIGTVVICTLIAATTGIGATGVIIMGVLALPEMLKRGYDRGLAMGCIPFGGALGPLIPPSVLMVIIAGFSQLSVGKLFMGGVFPGLILSFLAILYIGIRCLHNPHLGPALPPAERAILKEKFASLTPTLPMIALIVLVLGTIYTGITTPTEAGSFGSAGALICAAIYRRLNWANLKDAAIMTLKITCMVIWLLIGGGTFASLMTTSGVGNFIGESLIGLPVPPMGVIGIMMLVALIMGMLMDGAAITVILIPIFMPVVQALGFDPLWFALLFTINMVIGYISPPFGVNLFYLKGLAPDISMGELYRSAWPYVVLGVLVIALGMAFPQILTWLPNTMIK